MLHDFRLLRARRLISSGRRQAFGKAQHKQDVIGAALIGSAIALYWTNWERVAEINVFAAVLAVQARILALQSACCRGTWGIRR